MKTDLSEKLRADGVEALLQPFSEEPDDWNGEQIGEGGGQTRRCRSRRCVCRPVGHSCDGFRGAAAWLRVWHTRLSRVSSAISSLIAGVSQLRTRIMEMSADAAGQNKGPLRAVRHST